MFVLKPIRVTDSVLTASNLAENDHAAYNPATSYAVGDRVIVVNSTVPKVRFEAWTKDHDIYWSPQLNRATTTVIAGGRIGRALADVARDTFTGGIAVHAIYESVTAPNQGNDPVTDAAGENWVLVSAVNRWRAFDDTISAPATATGDISFEITPASRCSGVALFNVNAGSVSVEIRDPENALVHSETKTMTNTDEIRDWASFFDWAPARHTEALFTDLPGHPGYRITITVHGPNARVGEVVLGRVVSLGITMEGTEVGFDSYSRKERDPFGKVVLIRRASSDTVTFKFAIGLGDLRHVHKTVQALESTPAVWFAGADLLNRGATIYGFPSVGLRVPLSTAGYHFASLEIEGLT